MKKSMTLRSLGLAIAATAIASAFAFSMLAPANAFSVKGVTVEENEGPAGNRMNGEHDHGQHHNDCKQENQNCESDGDND